MLFKSFVNKITTPQLPKPSFHTTNVFFETDGTFLAQEWGVFREAVNCHKFAIILNSSHREEFDWKVRAKIQNVMKKGEICNLCIL